MKRIVIKIGSNVLTRADGTLDVTRISSLVDQVQAIRADGAQVLLVSSGAVACGRSLLGRRGTAHKLDPVEQRQLYSAVGQVQLIGLYSRLFQDWNTTIGQVLTMKESFSTRREYLNQRACMEVMLAHDVVPIINENDTVSVTELMFTDNDELSGLVASMMDADTLMILSNVDGIYDGPPSDPASKVIAKVHPGEDISGGIGAQKSGFGRGGMRSKYAIATHAAEEGIRVLIANGKREGIVKLYRVRPGPGRRLQREEMDCAQQRLCQRHGHGQCSRVRSPVRRTGGEPASSGRRLGPGGFRGRRHHRHPGSFRGPVRRRPQRLQRRPGEGSDRPA